MIMDNYIDIKATLSKRFFTSAEDKKLAENFKNREQDEFSFQKMEWKADNEVRGFRGEFIGIYV